MDIQSILLGTGLQPHYRGLNWFQCNLRLISWTCVEITGWIFLGKKTFVIVNKVRTVPLAAVIGLTGIEANLHWNMQYGATSPAHLCWRCGAAFNTSCLLFDVTGACWGCWTRSGRSPSSTTPTTPSPRATRHLGGSGTLTRSSSTPCSVSQQDVHKHTHFFFYCFFSHKCQASAEKQRTRLHCGLCGGFKNSSSVVNAAVWFKLNTC